MGKRSLQQMQAEEDEVDEENFDDYDNDYDEDEGDDASADSNESDGPSSFGQTTKSDAEVPLFEKLKALQQQQEDESFANVVSSSRRRKGSVRKHVSREEADEDRESRKTNKHGPAIMRSDRPVKRFLFYVFSIGEE